MSGSGGGGGSFPGGGGSGTGGRSGGVAGGGSGGMEPIPCEELAFETQLSSPKSEVITGIKRGDVLDVVSTQEGTVRTIQVLYKGKVAGGLTAPDVSRLRECILGGYKYTATVIEVKSGQVKVRVSLATPSKHDD